MRKLTKELAFAAMAASALGAFGQGAVGVPDSYVRQRAVAEMQRVSEQVDMLASNQEELAARLQKAESLKAEIESLRAEVAALRGAVAELRREMQGQRGEIVQDLSKRIAALQPPQPPRQPPKAPAYSGPCVEYTVEKGDTLTVIAQALHTTVQKIKEVNGLKSDALRIGQKLIVPKE